MDIISILRRLPDIAAYNKFDDDLFDRLNYSHTVTILTIFAIVVTNRQFSDNQIKCWVPAQFTGSYEQYVNQICFITNTYSHEMDQNLKNDLNEHHEHELKYYQWTPFILLLMAILFYIPHKFWRGLSLRSGVDIKDLIEAAQTYRSANIRHEDKIKLLDYITSWLNIYCSRIYCLSELKSPKTCIKVKGNYLILNYLVIKFLYLFNSIGQIFLLNVLLGREFWYYGIEIIRQYWTKQIGLIHSGNNYFPKVVLCDFVVREPNHPRESHRYTVQCVLSFNLFNQQIFTYLYFWLLILSIFNVLSIFIWIYRLFPCTAYNYLQRRLTVHFLTEEHSNEQDIRHLFVSHYLQGDGIFMLRLVASNVSDYVCTKIVLELYRRFRTSFLNEKIGHQSLFEKTLQIQFDDLPMPNPRHGKLLNEQNEIEKAKRSIAKDNDGVPKISIDSPYATVIRQSINLESCVNHETTPTLLIKAKSPSPYATTYLTKKNESEHEMSCTEDNILHYSNSDRVENNNVAQQLSFMRNQRTHDV